MTNRSTFVYLENNVADNENSTNDLDDLFTVKDDGKDEFAELFSKNDNDKPDLSDESSLALDLPGSSESIPDFEGVVDDRDRRRPLQSRK